MNGLAAVAGFIGILVVLRPDFSDVSFATAMPVAAGIFYALGALSTRNLCFGEGTLALLFGFFTSMLLLGGAGCIWFSIFRMDAPDGPAGFLMRGWVPMTWDFLLLAAVQAIGSVIGVALIIRGYLLADAAVVTVFEYTLLVFAAFWGYALWSDRLDIWAAAGIALIIVSGGVLARIQQKP